MDRFWGTLQVPWREPKVKAFVQGARSAARGTSDMGKALAGTGCWGSSHREFGPAGELRGCVERCCAWNCLCLPVRSALADTVWGRRGCPACRESDRCLVSVSKNSFDAIVRGSGVGIIRCPDTPAPVTVHAMLTEGEQGTAEY